MNDNFADYENTSIKPSDGENSCNEYVTSNNQVSLKQIIEALLFAENNPLPLNRLVEITQASAEQIINVLKELNQEYETSKRAFRIEQVANGYQLYTLPEFSPWIRNLYKTPYHRLSRPALETLAII
ncbi:MAG: SMC-Scp complex subunit ScpB, partial [candidate division WOR-3 bacterium]|nr:SMC-Scp complex subunit ScpB [candidate division WOR-3 bacterium]